MPNQTYLRSSPLRKLWTPERMSPDFDGCKLMISCSSTWCSEGLSLIREAGSSKYVGTNACCNPFLHFPRGVSRWRAARASAEKHGGADESRLGATLVISRCQTLQVWTGRPESEGTGDAATRLLHWLGDRVGWCGENCRRPS